MVGGGGGGAGSSSSAAGAGSGGAVAAPAIKAGREHVEQCFESLEAAFAGGATPPPRFDATVSCPFFVTLQKWEPARREYHLRGCIGSLSPRPLADLAKFARKSAFEDGRFEPLTAGEVPALEIGVSLLVAYEPAAGGPEDWVVGKHGVILEFAAGGRRYSATYLPEVAAEQGWTQREALESLVRKAGYREPLTAAVWGTMSVTRYQSSKAKLSYAEWRAAAAAKR